MSRGSPRGSRPSILSSRTANSRRRSSRADAAISPTRSRARASRSSCVGPRSATCCRAPTTCGVSTGSSRRSAGSAVPVPAVVDVVDDADRARVTGTVFFVMERVAGQRAGSPRPERRLLARGPARPEHRTRAAPRRPARDRARHASDSPTSAVPTGTSAARSRRGGASSTRRARARHPRSTRCRRRSPRACPPRRGPGSCTATTASTTPSWSAPAIEPHISAILDWEMATLGDPFVDLGIFALYWDIASSPRRLRRRGAERRGPGGRIPGLRRAGRGLRRTRGHRRARPAAGTARSPRTSSR